MNEMLGIMFNVAETSENNEKNENENEANGNQEAEQIVKKTARDIIESSNEADHISFPDG